VETFDRGSRFKSAFTSASAVSTSPAQAPFLPSSLLSFDRRKKVWEENATNPHVFPHKLFSEAALQSIFDCTVEVGSAFCGFTTCH